MGDKGRELAREAAAVQYEEAGGEQGKGIGKGGGSSAVLGSWVRALPREAPRTNKQTAA